MIFIALGIIALIIVVCKRAHHCLHIVCLALVYGIIDLANAYGFLLDEKISYITGYLVIPVLLLLLVFTLRYFNDRDVDKKKYIFPIIFCTGMTIVKIVRYISLSVYTVQADKMGDVGERVFEAIFAVSTALDIIHFILGIGLIVSLIVYISALYVQSES